MYSKLISPGIHPGQVQEISWVPFFFANNEQNHLPLFVTDAAASSRTQTFHDNS